MRILVCGGRSYGDITRIAQILDKIHRERGITTLIHGGARGADAIADAWANYNNVEREEFCADWKHLGPRAGPIRNQRMIEDGKPHAVVAFPGGRGTADMTFRARLAGLPVWEITE